MATFPLLALNGLGFTVWTATGRRTEILNGISLGIANGEVVAITGPSRGGKSTLLRAILGLVRFTEGALEFTGNAISRPLDLTHRRLRAVTEAVFHDPVAALSPHARLRSTIAEPLKAQGVTSLHCDALVEKMAMRMGLTPALLDRRPEAVSVG